PCIAPPLPARPCPTPFQPCPTPALPHPIPSLLHEQQQQQDVGVVRRMSSSKSSRM
ncbi:hypothetical protein QJQ45_023168, partial [Haematococcus lacustris]